MLDVFLHLQKRRNFENIITTPSGNVRTPIVIRSYPLVAHLCHTALERRNSPLFSCRRWHCTKCRYFRKKLITTIPAISAVDKALELEAFEAMMNSEVQNNEDEDIMKWGTIDTEEDNVKLSFPYNTWPIISVGRSFTLPKGSYWFDPAGRIILGRPCR